jgi:translation initiation factor 2 alpha subunit (eIF-2alpha)
MRDQHLSEILDEIQEDQNQKIKDLMTIHDEKIHELFNQMLELLESKNENQEKLINSNKMSEKHNQELLEVEERTD